jgi:hypothetical protein
LGDESGLQLLHFDGISEILRHRQSMNYPNMNYPERCSLNISCFAKDRLQGLDDLPIGFLESTPNLVIKMLSLVM